MGREALLALEKEAPVDLVVQLHARVDELGAAVARLSGPPKNPGNSSVPPSQGFKPNRAERRAKAFAADTMARKAFPRQV